MKELFLVTTALEDTWPESNKSILFLGEWCRLYSRKQHWMKLDSELVPYHWDDRVKLYEDYKYLRELYERLLIQLTLKLNEIHGVNYSVRYWRILIGPWLMMFIPIVYDRWSCLNKALDSYAVTETIVHEEFDLKYIPQCMEHFSKLAKSDLWNHALYTTILKFIDFGEISRIKNDKAVSFDLVDYTVDKKNWISKIKGMMLKLISFMSLNNYFIIKPYLNKFDLIKLYFKLGRFPAVYQGGSINVFTPDQENRKFEISNFKYKNKFEQFIKDIIPLQLPIAYLEGYQGLVKQVAAKGWPKKPNLIWTSNSFYMDEIFKLWSAERVEEKVPLVIGQHGGHYGQGLFSFLEYHEIKICDYYLSWGWGDGNDKIIPVGAVKRPIKTKKTLRSNESILFIISATSRYSGGIASIPISSQWLEYMDDQIDFYKCLLKDISSNVIVRLYPHDDDWSQSARWKNELPDTNIDDGKEDFNNKLSNMKLLISGWNTTTYLESMLSNIPTVIFWKPEYFEIRDDSKKLFENLKTVGILHDDPISAANHVNKIWNDVEVWWNHPDVISARNEFTKKYVYSNNLLERLSCVLKDISDRQYLK